ncbi:hypothetical protein EXIGLDRAFT_732468 [Exidia glandulosa HHB12029]|uniref:Uncharacterized protein n=1 Tax=Exidia glandulosa HHB12029 TaxID=1314781 RepID=A0A165BHS3_EXIGL|nr:hypothetical protein EXIGLDRAFT_732468 [Exidia glandulosa HHB12029]
MREQAVSITAGSSCFPSTSAIHTASYAHSTYLTGCRRTWFLKRDTSVVLADADALSASLDRPVLSCCCWRVEDEQDVLYHCDRLASALMHAAVCPMSSLAPLSRPVFSYPTRPPLMSTLAHHFLAHSLTSIASPSSFCSVPPPIILCTRSLWTL